MKHTLTVIDLKIACEEAQAPFNSKNTIECHWFPRLLTDHLIGLYLKTAPGFQPEKFSLKFEENPHVDEGGKTYGICTFYDVQTEEHLSYCMVGTHSYEIENLDCALLKTLKDGIARLNKGW